MDGDVLSARRILVSDKACFGCWINCGKLLQVQLPGKAQVLSKARNMRPRLCAGGTAIFPRCRRWPMPTGCATTWAWIPFPGGSVNRFCHGVLREGADHQRGLVVVKQLHGGSIDDFGMYIHGTYYRQASEGKIGDLLARGLANAAEHARWGGSRIRSSSRRVSNFRATSPLAAPAIAALLI